MLPPFLTRENMGVYSGLLDALKSNCTYLRLSRQEYIVLTNSHTIYNMDYTDALKYHIEKGADVTVLYAARREGSSAPRAKTTRSSPSMRTARLRAWKSVPPCRPATAPP